MSTREEEIVQMLCRAMEDGDTLWKPEFYDLIQVLDMGASKYKKDGWLDADGACTSHKDNHASMFRHLAESSAGIKEDRESGLHPLLHLATRALMGYTRHVRGIVNPEDSNG